MGSRYEPLFEQLRQAAQPDRPVPPAARRYADDVAHRAHAIADADVDALRDAGLSEDEIFELTVSLAVAAGLERWAAGKAALG
jgi:alkylhydroperoxidase family enzyme